VEHERPGRARLVVVVRVRHHGAAAGQVDAVHITAFDPPAQDAEADAVRRAAAGDSVDPAARADGVAVARVYSDNEGVLTADYVIGALRPAVAPSIYMCGPRAMGTSLSRGFEELGVPRRDIRWEEFDAR
jgi:hypothetical protein